MTLEFRVLGGLEVLVDGIDRAPTAPKVKQVLALLLARAGRVVPAETLIREVWDDRPPSSAATTIQTYVYQLRKLFAQHGLATPHGELLTTRGSGYLLAVDPLAVDERVFREAVEHGQRMFDTGRYGEATSHLLQALRTWRGDPFDGMDRGQLLEGHALRLQEMHTLGVRLRMEGGMRLGLHRELLGDLRLLVSENPLDEWLHGRLIEALSRCGRRSEALEAFQCMRRLLDVELGLPPSQDSRRLQAEILNA